VRAGNLRHRVTFQTRSDTSDGAGGVTSTWGSPQTVWAEVLPLSGSEQLRAMQLEEQVTHRVITRSGAASISNSMRMTFDSRTFNVLASYEVDHRNRRVETLVREGGPV
jgi:SPP1 family predicted phage head-tail adaptor